MDFSGLVRNDYSGHRWIIVTEVAAGAQGAVDFLERSGAAELFLLSGNRGVGDIPDIPAFDLATSGPTIMGGIRAFESGVLDLPKEALSALDEFDPERTAKVLFAGFGTPTSIAGRPVFAPRPPEWLALEDKIAVLGIWDEAGIAIAPARVVPPSLDQLTTAHRELNAGLGTVAVADNRSGWHGGGEYLRRIRSDDDLAPISAFLDECADQVRVMPFLDGIPCSIHGFVAANGVATFRPVEMLILWSGKRLVYAGVATTWDPSAEDRMEMRSAAKAVGDVLRHRVSYRGGFSLDGVMTADGFRPTEVNPRVSVGLGIQLGEIDDIPLGALTRHLIANPDAAIDLEEMEARIVGNADTVRTSRAMFTTSWPLEAAERTVQLADGRISDAPDGPIRLNAGPSLHGGVVFVGAASDVVPRGTSFAPVVAACAPYVERWLGIEIGDLDYATDVRT